MVTEEKKVDAAVKLLRIMTELLLETVNDPEKSLELAFEHRDRFEAATKDDPELYAAGLEIARRLAREA